MPAHRQVPVANVGAAAAGAEVEEFTSLAPADFKGAEQQTEAVAKYKLPEHVVQVLNERTKTVHLTSGDGVFCSKWACGTVLAPAATACFANCQDRWSPDRSPVAFCMACHSLKLISKNGGALLLDEVPVEVDGSSSSSSESSSSSSSS